MFFLNEKDAFFLTSIAKWSFYLKAMEVFKKEADSFSLVTTQGPSPSTPWTVPCGTIGPGDGEGLGGY
jgi:hypothetical protein